jgi:hypothetical protein
VVVASSNFIRLQLYPLAASALSACSKWLLQAQTLSDKHGAAIKGKRSLCATTGKKVICLSFPFLCLSSVSEFRF